MGSEISKQARRDFWSGASILLLLFAAFFVVSQRMFHARFARPSPEVGTPAPALLGHSIGGGADLLSLRGRVVLVDFWATWCPPCVVALPTLSNLADEYGPRGFTVLGVNQDGQDETLVRAFSKARGLTFDSILDSGDLAERYGVYTFPTSFLVDRGGLIARVYRGSPRESTLRRDIEALLSRSVALAPDASASLEHDTP